ncbi:MAG TPA: efflux RND transporter periplasmic adaptor subunit, partial [Polyangiaceae bacterium]
TVIRQAIAHEEPIAEIYRASGTVRGRNTTILTSKTTGYVRVVHVRSGDRVVGGQLVAQLETNDVRSMVTRARATIDRAAASKAEAESALEAVRAEAKVAKLLFQRESELFNSAAISRQQFDEADARFRSATARESVAEARIRAGASGIDEARASLGEAQATLAYASIVAPFAGRVLERHVDPGALATPGMPLLVIADEDTLRVEVPVEATRADNVREGDVVDIEVDTVPKPILGKIGEIVPNVDVTSRAFLVKVDLPPNVGQLRPGTFARVSFRMGARARLVVPTTAITSFGALDRVFVVDERSARLRMITTGETHGTWTEVLSGLSSSERVVAMPPASLCDGSKIEVEL